MDLTPMQIFWAVLVFAAFVGFAVLVWRQTKAGKDVGVPTSFETEAHDLPPEGSDAYVQEEMRRADSEAERKHEEAVGVHPKQRI